MKTKVKALLLLGLAMLLVLLVVAPAVASPEPAPASNIEKVTLVHYPTGKGLVKPAAKPTPGSTNDYYKLLRVSWDVPVGGVPFTLATAGWPSSGAPSYQAVRAEMEAAFEAWDEATATTDLFKDNIEYGGVVGPYRDNKNTISFGPVSYAGALAVTTYWYNRATGRFVEADIEFSTSYRWGIDPDGEGGAQTLDSSTFDVRNVGTHEVGHVVGLADLYRTNYSELTMYGYASPAETLKRSLQNGDILGTEKLYGE
jgi:Matrixin